MGAERMTAHEMKLFRRIAEALETIASGFKQQVPPASNPLKPDVPPKGKDLECTLQGIRNAIADIRARSLYSYIKDHGPSVLRNAIADIRARSRLSYLELAQRFEDLAKEADTCGFEAQAEQLRGYAQTHRYSATLFDPEPNP
jgi:hypothetical protein